MNKIKLILGLALATLLMGQAHAVLINGAIAINLKTGSTVSFDPTSVSFSLGPNGTVNGATGDYVGYIGNDATYSDFQYAPLISGEVWSIDLTPTTSFTLTSVVGGIDGFGNLSLSGSGIAKMFGKDDTGGIWSFSADQTGIFNFSSTTSVPDSGATAALLGLGLLGLAGAARRFKK
jgi:hypothetical protein